MAVNRESRLGQAFDRIKFPLFGMIAAVSGGVAVADIGVRLAENAGIFGPASIENQKMFFGHLIKDIPLQDDKALLISIPVFIPAVIGYFLAFKELQRRIR